MILKRFFSVLISYIIATTSLKLDVIYAKFIGNDIVCVN
ncbi:hypothetical protein FP742_14790 [Vibrio parahaemolyticus]|uniref:Uncharacterized protein n=3 Tax=Vibrio harveyi group TaxID=717610 RepID=A0A227F1D9_VIBPH|nr:hypothetical protein BMI84_01990 [Vibrio parahaemolyticus]AVF64589.1 hypothetical protein AL541_09375 [Vibrio alginolyticus]EAS74249.1 hypothetical protein V12G01_00260 [Vibrio alginolyticus 12G01]EDM58417.1 conserved hypothetical protein [Vibrio parahaemolyticus AQ3810]EFO44656.1 conserved hypothetical protein [Vibrio parahaemolyticus AQ4037]EQL86054.1 hypothetical protein D036_2719 [Vibrio parahaemolyticus VP232]EQL96097.1 hypothetical protein D035_2536 [Vibrio parahaemolyticus VP250]EQ